MEAEFWAGRWNTGNINGFHEGSPNAFLQAHGAHLGTGRVVLVPLCGKAEDLAYLAKLGHRVVGVELIESAARAFFTEHQLTPVETTRGPFTVLTSGDVSIFIGDFFATTRDLLGPVDALFDRAAIIALPPEMRVRYAAHLRALLPAGSPALIVAIEYDQSKADGPPFSVPEAELAKHYAGLKRTRLATIPLKNQRLNAAAPGGTENCFAMTF